GGGGGGGGGGGAVGLGVGGGGGGDGGTRASAIDSAHRGRPSASLRAGRRATPHRGRVASTLSAFLGREPGSACALRRTLKCRTSRLAGRSARHPLRCLLPGRSPHISRVGGGRRASSASTPRSIYVPAAPFGSRTASQTAASR